MSNYRCIQIELTRGYDYTSFREDLKQLYHSAGVKGENTVFLFSDTQVTDTKNIIYSENGIRDSQEDKAYLLLDHIKTVVNLLINMAGKSVQNL